MDIKIDSATGDVVFGVVSTTDIMATTYDSGYGYGYGYGLKTEKLTWLERIKNLF